MRPATRQPTGAADAQATPTPPRRREWAALLLLLGIAVAYAPGVRNGFVDWDDDVYIRDNAYLRSPAGLRAIWLTRELPQYYPVTFTSHWLECQLWGERAAGYYVVNVVLHAAAALLSFALFQALGAGPRAAWLAAAIFALHPVQVGSVAWLAERKNLLAGLFSVITLLLYVRHRQTGHWRWYATTLTAFALAVLSKSVALATLPSMWLMDRWALGRRGWGGVLRLVPAAALAVLPVLVTAEREGALGSAGAASAPARLLHAAAALWAYVGKFVLPVTLSPLYAKWNIALTSPLGWAALGAVVAAVVAVVLVRRRLGGLVLWGLAHFVIALVPALGLVHFGYLRHAPFADHLAYSAWLGAGLAVAVGLDRGAGALSPRRRWVVRTAVPGLLLLALAAKSFVQVQVWRDPETLWSYVLRHNPRAAPAWVGRGRLAEARGDLAGALACFQKAVEYDPDNFHARSNLCVALARSGRLVEAVRQGTVAVELNPQSVEARTNLASALLDAGRLDEARPHATRAVELVPQDPIAHLTLGTILAAGGDVSRAVEHFQTAVRLDPRNALAHLRLAQGFAEQGRLEAALAACRRAVNLQPDDFAARRLLAALEAAARPQRP
ncbi:MAG: tetratricopeptide repeat protein [Planctomycetota bacterium]